MKLSRRLRKQAARSLALAHRRAAQLDLLLDDLDQRLQGLMEQLVQRLMQAARLRNELARAEAIQAAWDWYSAQVSKATAQYDEQAGELYAESLAKMIPAAVAPRIYAHTLPAEQPQPVQEALAVQFDDDGTAARGVTSNPRRAAGRAMMTKTEASQASKFRKFSDPLTSALSERLWTKKQAREVESLVKRAYQEGWDMGRLTSEIRQKTQAASWAARRVARTEIRRGLEFQQFQSITALAKQGDVAGVMICAVMDERTRPEHAFRHGTIFSFSNGEIFHDDGVQFPRLPDAPNCRCTYVPIFYEDAQGDPDGPGSDAVGNIIANFKTYEQLWQEADERQRRRMIGSERYDYLMDLVGHVHPAYCFRPDGTLRPLDDIKVYAQSFPWLSDQRWLHHFASVDVGYTLKQAGHPLIGPLGMQRLVPDLLRRGVARTPLTDDQLRSRLEGMASAELRHVRQGKWLDPETRANAIERIGHEMFLQAMAVSPEGGQRMLTLRRWMAIQRSLVLELLTPQTAQHGKVELSPNSSILPEQLERAQAAADWLARLIPKGKNLHFDLQFQLHRAGYVTEDRMVWVTATDPVQICLHEMLHGLDHQLTGYTLDQRFLPRVDQSRVRYDADNKKGWVYAAPADSQTPMSVYMFMYYPQRENHYPITPQVRYRFKEFVSIVGQLLYDNAYRAILLDRKSVVQWLQTFDEVFWSNHQYSSLSPVSPGGEASSSQPASGSSGRSSRSRGRGKRS